MASHQTVRLSAGCHLGPEDGMCAVELASVLAGESFSDHPRAVSPAVAAVLRGYNDGLDAERRQDLKPLSTACVGSAAGPRAELIRAEMIRTSFPGPSRSWIGMPRALRRVRRPAPYRKAILAGWRGAKGDDVLHVRMLEFIAGLTRVSPGPEPVRWCPPVPWPGTRTVERRARS